MHDNLVSKSRRTLFEFWLCCSFTLIHEHCLKLFAITFQNRPEKKMCIVYWSSLNNNNRGQACCLNENEETQWHFPGYVPKQCELYVCVLKSGREKTLFCDTPLADNGIWVRSYYYIKPWLKKQPAITCTHKGMRWKPKTQPTVSMVSLPCCQD